LVIGEDAAVEGVGRIYRDTQLSGCM
jgi:hypothetical protein